MKVEDNGELAPHIENTDLPSKYQQCHFPPETPLSAINSTSEKKTQHRARLLSMATAVPPYELTQEAVASEAHELFPDRGEELKRLLPVYQNAGIAKRYSCLPLEDYKKPGSWKEKNEHYLENAVDLLEKAARNCLEEAGSTAEEVDAIVAVSTTGLATPSLEARLMGRLPFRADVERLPIFGLGCAGGVLGLARAAALTQAKPGTKVLFLVVELCALTFRHGDHSDANIVATALFGDGAAAVLLTSGQGDEKGEGFAEIAHWGEHTWPQSLDVMGWSVENDGLGVVFSQDIPTIVRKKLGSALDDYLAREGLERSDIDGYIAHPGGAKVVRALESAFNLQRGSLQIAREVLRDYGNMSAATVLFVLDAERRKGLYGRQVMTALGPGFTAAFLTLEGSGTHAKGHEFPGVAAQ